MKNFSTPPKILAEISQFPIRANLLNLVSLNLSYLKYSEETFDLNCFENYTYWLWFNEFNTQLKRVLEGKQKVHFYFLIDLRDMSGLHE